MRHRALIVVSCISIVWNRRGHRVGRIGSVLPGRVNRPVIIRQGRTHCIKPESRILITRRRKATWQDPPTTRCQWWILVASLTIPIYITTGNSVWVCFGCIYRNSRLINSNGSGHFVLSSSGLAGHMRCCGRCLWLENWRILIMLRTIQLTVDSWNWGTSGRVWTIRRIAISVVHVSINSLPKKTRNRVSPDIMQKQLIKILVCKFKWKPTPASFFFLLKEMLLWQFYVNIFWKAKSLLGRAVECCDFQVTAVWVEPVTEAKSPL